MKKSKNAKKIATIEVENCNIFTLHKQKKKLLKLIWNKPNSVLWGLVNLLDYIDDKYYYMDTPEQLKAMHG